MKIKEIMSIPVTVFPHKVSDGRGKRRIGGYYVHMSRLWPLDELLKQSMGSHRKRMGVVGFVGMHSCLCFAIGAPGVLRNVVKVGEAILEVTTRESRVGKKVVWLGQVKLYKVSKYGYKMYVPSKVWNLNKVMRGRKLYTTAEVSQLKNGLIVISVPVLHK